MRFYTQQHKFYCGIDLHARTMYVCVLNQEGEVLLHRDMKAAPGPFLQAIAPYREDVVVCVKCIFTSCSCGSSQRYWQSIFHRPDYGDGH
jgi:hypothetical protein